VLFRSASPTRFDEYEQQVRAEYRWVPGWLFRRKRREVLQGFAQRPLLYLTPIAQQCLEAPARANLRRALA
jgi:predicted metal-dependent HD superfamily phosphohydrolase